MTSGEITVTIKCTTGQKFTVELTPDKNIKDLKELCSKETDVEVERQRLIYKGHVLKDDRTIESYGIENEHTVILVKGSKPKPKPDPNAPQPAAAPVVQPTAALPDAPSAANTGAAPQQPAFDPFAMLSAMGGGGGMGAMGSGMGGGGQGANPMASMMQNPEMIGQMMSNPMVQQMMQQMMQNPAMLDQMINTNPALRQMTETNPMLRQQMQGILGNPQMMQNMMDPSVIRMAMGMQGMQQPAPSTGAATGTTGTGDQTQPAQAAQPAQPDFSQLSSLMNQMMQPPQGQAAAQPAAAQGVGAAQPNPFAALFGAQAAQSGAAQPAAAVASQPAVQPEILYREQLAQLNGMGFTDAEANIRCLVATGGNVSASIDMILSGP
eukprot:44626_1